MTCNTVPLTPQLRTNEKVLQMSVAPLLAEAIRRIHGRKSVSALFK